MLRNGFRLFLGLLLFLGRGPLQSPHSFAHGLADLRKFRRAEYDQDDHKDDHKFRYTKTKQQFHLLNRERATNAP